MLHGATQLKMPMASPYIFPLKKNIHLITQIFYLVRIVNGTNSLRNCSAHNTSRVELYHEENSGSNKLKEIIFDRIHVIYKDVKIHIQSSYLDQAIWVIVENCIKEFNKRINWTNIPILLPHVSKVKLNWMTHQWSPLKMDLIIMSCNKELMASIVVTLEDILSYDQQQIWVLGCIIKFFKRTSEE